MKLKTFIYVFIILILIIFFFQHKNTALFKTNTDAYYSGSKTCMQCHKEQHSSWHNSLHPKIFKPYTDDSQIVADFKNKPDFVKFDKKDIEVIIGGKWEQVFAREIEGEYYPFPAKWMVLTQEWIPYKTKKWKKTPLTQKCNGCHTTGLNKETGDFAEYGVSCESCHGPGSTHVQNKKMVKNIECMICHTDKQGKHKKNDIILSYKSAVCGQCHSRGTQNTITTHHTEVQFNFPLEYLPGADISTKFKPTTPQTDTKNKNWWGNGISKNRHQEYADFALSGHANSLKDLKEKRSKECGEPKDSCLKCHSADYILAKDKEKPTLQNAKLGLTCVVCHNPHTLKGKNKAEVTTRCQNCHVGTLPKQFSKEKVKEHYPCPTEKVTCADCHMPKIVKTGGKFSLRSHAFKIIPPQATEKYGMPNSCQNGSCHTDKDTKWAKEQFDKFYNKNKKTLAETIKNDK